MDRSKPLISIVTVCFNSEATIRETIKSVCAQTYDNFEYIIVDGCSTDHTLEIVRSYIPVLGNKLRIISEKDTGIYNAMNKGIRLCHGEIIGLINSDDHYAETALEHVADKYAEENQKLLVINGDAIRISENDVEICSYHYTEENIVNKEYLLHPAMFATRAVYDRIGLYDEKYRLAADYDWQCRVYNDEDVKYVLSPYILSYMRAGGASDALKYRWKWFAERSEIKRKHKVASPAKVFLQEFKAVIRTDIKAILPEKFQPVAYKFLYRNKYRKEHA